MTYQEAIIVPLDIFNKCIFSQKEIEQQTEHNRERSIKEAIQKDILQNKTLPPDVKIKLYHQKKRS